MLGIKEASYILGCKDLSMSMFMFDEPIFRCFYFTFTTKGATKVQQIVEILIPTQTIPAVPAPFLIRHSYQELYGKKGRLPACVNHVWCQSLLNYPKQKMLILYAEIFCLFVSSALLSLGRMENKIWLLRARDTK